jgi:hypothetical protein
MEPADVEAILCAYGAVLATRGTFTGARDIKTLPYPKSDIKSALIAALGGTTDGHRREQLKIAYMVLADFQDLSEAELLAFQTLFTRGAKPLSAEEMTPAMLQHTEAIFPVIARIGQEASVLRQELKAAGIA